MTALTGCAGSLPKPADLQRSVLQHEVQAFHDHQRELHERGVIIDQFGFQGGKFYIGLDRKTVPGSEMILKMTIGSFDLVIREGLRPPTAL
jgi:hypothetical protein